MSRLEGDKMSMLRVSQRILIGTGHVIFLILLHGLIGHPRGLSDSKIANKLHSTSLGLKILNLVIKFFLISLNRMIMLLLFEYSTLCN